MSDIAKLLANVGGALSAQGTGGSQGLQAFMNTLARQQEQELQRSFAREQETRQRMFQMDRDRLAHQRALQLQKNELDAKQSADVERNEAAANELVAWGRLNKGNEDALQSSFAAAMGPNTPDGTVAPLNLADPDVVSRVRGALGFGMTFRATEARAQQTQQQADWLSTHAPTVQLDDKNPQGQLLELQRGWSAATTALSTHEATADALTTRWNNLNPATADPTTLAQEVAALDDELTKLAASANAQFAPGGMYGHFVVSGAKLRPGYEAISGKIDALSKNLEQGLQNRALNSLVNFNPADLSTWVPGLDGFEGTGRTVISSPQFDGPNNAWSTDARAIVELPTNAYEEGSGQEAFRQELATLRGEYEDANKQFDLRTLMHEWTAATEAGDTAKADDLARIIQGVASENVPAVQQRVALQQRREDELNKVLFAGGQLSSNEKLGISLAPDRETAQLLLAKYGQEDGPVRIMGDENQFWSRVLASEEGLDLLINGYTQGMVAEGESMTLQDQAEQVLERAQYGINQLGFTIPDLKQRVARRFANDFGLTATVSPATVGEAFTDLDTGSITATSPKNVRSVSGLVSLLPNGRQAFQAWRQAYSDLIMGGAFTDPTERERLARTLLLESQQGAPRFEQEAVSRFGSRPWVRGREQRLRFDPESAAHLDGNFSFYDLTTIWKNLDSFAKEFEYGGAVENKAIVQPATTRRMRGTEVHFRQMTKPWARGEGRDYIFGNKSHVKAYRQLAAANNVEVDPQLELQIGWLDFIQAADLNSASVVQSHSPALLTILRDQQQFVRNTPTAQLVDLMQGEGFSPEQLSLARPADEVAAEAGQTPPIPQLAALQGGDAARLEEVTEELLALQARSYEVGQWMDLDPTTGEHWGILTAPMYEHTVAQLTATQEDLQNRINAANSGIVRDTRKSLMGATTVPTDLKSLGAMIRDAKAWWSGETIDMVAVEESRLDTWATSAEEKTSAKAGLRVMLNMVADNAAKQSAAMARGVGTMIPQAERELSVAHVEREVSIVLEEVDALAEFFLVNSPDSTDEIVDPYIQRGLASAGSDVEKLFKDLNSSDATTRADASVWLGYQVWRLQQARSEN